MPEKPENNKKDTAKQADKPTEEIDLARRMLMKAGAFTVPAIVASFTISGSAYAQTTCNPNLCGPEKCAPGGGCPPQGGTCPPNPQRRALDAPDKSGASKSQNGCGPKIFKPTACVPASKK